jgi:hypothetical protein
VRAACRERKAVLIQRLAPLLEEAGDVSRELGALEDRERNLTGDWHLTGFAWPELQAPSTVQNSRLVDWRQAAVAAGLLEQAN